MKITVDDGLNTNYYYSSFNKVEDTEDSNTKNSSSSDDVANATDLAALQLALYGAKKLSELKAKNSTSFKNTLSAVSNAISGTVTSDSSSMKERESVLDPIFSEAAETYHVDKSLLLAIAKQESGFKTDATSSAGAMGVMQLMPETAKGLGVTDAYDAYQNIMGGANKISGLISKYNGDLSLALAAYNAGSGNVEKYGGIPPFSETQHYVSNVLANYASYATA